MYLAIRIIHPVPRSCIRADLFLVCLGCFRSTSRQAITEMGVKQLFYSTEWKISRSSS